MASPKKKASQQQQQRPYPEDEAFQFLYKPHTITAMIFGGVLLVYFAFTRDISIDTPSNVKSGLLAICLVFLLFSMLQMRDGLFKRPHPAFWRTVMGAAVLYLCLLVFLLFQSVEDVRERMLPYIDPSLGKELKYRDYAEHCDLYTPNDPTSSFRHLWDTINDEFILAHFLGWWVKSLMIRDASLCWVISILFEFWEMTFEFMLPNFKECWWDHIILDILVCNGLGIYLGMLTCRFLNMKEYDWGGMWKLPNKEGKMWYQVLQQFTPFSYDEYNWDMLKDYKRFLSVLIVIGMFSVVELSAFFLKYLLWLPPPHPLNIYRLLLWALIGMPGLREYFKFATDPTNKRFGTMAWLCCAISGMEVLICIKFAKGHFTEAPPPIVLWGWGTFLAVSIIGSVIFFNRRQPTKHKTK